MRLKNKLKDQLFGERGWKMEKRRKKKKKDERGVAISREKR